MKTLLRKKCRSKAGLVMVEVLVAVAIVAILAAIAVPSVNSIKNSLDQKQANDYAKAVYMAAQNQLTKQRASVGANALSATLGSGTKLSSGEYSAADTLNHYYSLKNGNSEDSAFSTMLPVGAVEDTVRGGNILIEYNDNGDVYTVLWSENPVAKSDLTNEGNRKANVIGYYHVDSAMKTTTPDEQGEPPAPPTPSSNPTEIEDEDKVLTFENGEEAVLVITLPYSGDNYQDYLNNLKVKLSINKSAKGQTENFMIDLNANNDPDYATRLSGPTVNTGAKTFTYRFVVDSLNSPFDILNESSYTMGSDIPVSLSLAGKNGKEVSEMYDVTDFNITINPLFADAADGEKVSDGVIKIENARHLNNLNRCALTNITTISIAKSFPWPATIWPADTVFAPVSNELLVGKDGGKGSVTTILGQQNTITGLKITDTNLSVGMFKWLNGVTVDGLYLDEVSISGSYNNADGTSIGAISGTMVGGAVSGCQVSNLTISAAGSSYAVNVGGLVGSVNGTEISDVMLSGTNSITTTGGKGSVGGLAGALTTEGKLYKCTAAVNITVDSSEALNVGGLVGKMSGSTLGKDSSTTSVSGKITNKNGGSKACVGGAVGLDKNNTTCSEYKNVTTSVELAQWGGSSSPSATANDPSGLGVYVGKFVGYVNNGSFANCESTQASGNYQFLGYVEGTEDTSTTTRSKVKSDGVYLAFEPTSTWLTTYASNLTGSSALNAGSSLGMLGASSVRWYSYAADLNNCYYEIGTSRYQQVLTKRYWELGYDSEAHSSLDEFLSTENAENILSFAPNCSALDSDNSLYKTANKKGLSYADLLYDALLSSTDLDYQCVFYDRTNKQIIKSADVANAHGWTFATSIATFNDFKNLNSQNYWSVIEYDFSAGSNTILMYNHRGSVLQMDGKAKPNYSSNTYSVFFTETSTNEYVLKAEDCSGSGSGTVYVLTYTGSGSEQGYQWVKESTTSVKNAPRFSLFDKAYIDGWSKYMNEHGSENSTTYSFSAANSTGFEVSICNSVLVP